MVLFIYTDKISYHIDNDQIWAVLVSRNSAQKHFEWSSD